MGELRQDIVIRARNEADAGFSAAAESAKRFAGQVAGSAGGGAGGAGLEGGIFGATLWGRAGIATMLKAGGYITALSAGLEIFGAAAQAARGDFEGAAASLKESVLVGKILVGPIEKVYMSMSGAATEAKEFTRQCELAAVALKGMEERQKASRALWGPGGLEEGIGAAWRESRGTADERALSKIVEERNKKLAELDEAWQKAGSNNRPRYLEDRGKLIETYGNLWNDEAEKQAAAAAEREARDAERADNEARQAAERQADILHRQRQFGSETERLDAEIAAGRLRAAGKAREAELLLIHQHYEELRRQAREEANIAPAELARRMAALGGRETVDLAAVMSKRAAPLTGGVESPVLTPWFSNAAGRFRSEDALPAIASGVADLKAQAAEAVKLLAQAVAALGQGNDFYAGGYPVEGHC